MIDPYLNEDIALMRGEAWMAEARPLCAYYRGIGICSFGCWEEPVCHTEEPLGGWQRRAYEIHIDVAETLRAAIRECRAELSRADVKNLRDQAREAHRRAVDNLAAVSDAPD